jgi:prepilin-type N-terminal cleavage/methylation domain-containing protein
MTRRGFTLLETMVALVILGLVVVGFFQMFGVSVRTAKNVETWTEAIWYAEAGMEMAKLDLNATVGRGSEPLEGGYIREVTVREWSQDLRVVTVTVTFPEGGRFTVDRLLEYR